MERPGELFSTKETVAGLRSRCSGSILRITDGGGHLDKRLSNMVWPAKSTKDNRPKRCRFFEYPRRGVRSPHRVGTSIAIRSLRMLFSRSTRVFFQNAASTGITLSL